MCDLAYNENDRTTTLSPLYNRNEAGDRVPEAGRDMTNGYAQAESNRDRDRGVPTNSTVRINSGDTRLTPADATGEEAWVRQRSDVLLYHELVHSRDHTRGTFDSRIVENGPNPYDLDGHLRQGEYRAVGMANEAISENAYRRARVGIANSGYGAREGDADMPQRDGYYYHERDRAGSGGTGGANPGTTRRGGCIGCMTGEGGHDH